MLLLRKVTEITQRTLNQKFELCVNYIEHENCGLSNLLKVKVA